MEKTDNFLIKRLLWKADKYKLPTKSSFLFKDLSPYMQQYLISYIQPKYSGPPVLFFTKPTNEWTLICTRQVICNDNKSTIAIEISNITSFTPTVLETSSNPTLLSYREGNHKKSEWHELTVVDKEDRRYILHADKGPDLFSLWNILIMAKRLLTE
ncbi:hypothetical protein [Sporocytophaga myxococcoides]|uniref:hypothetical protein n=1 Tax=Sporocytophaga myxococcoides TaxID=153721 RepID=UPI0003F65590|nr:hypothetical protein [Sporocytophaga myxococcoides]